MVGGYIEAGQGILRDVLISYLPENRSGGASTLSCPLEVPLDLASRDEQRRGEEGKIEM